MVPARQPAPAGTGRALVPTQRTRMAMARRLAAQAGRMTTAVVTEMEARHPWYNRLGAEERSWVTVVAGNGINGFVKWFVDDTAADVDPRGIFNAAPRELTRIIALDQAVDLIRTTVDVVEQQIGLVMPRSDRPPLATAILHYSREIAFASAQIYARAAETRVSWDERMEAVIVDAVLRADSNDDLLSRAATVGWRPRSKLVVAVGAVPEGDWSALRRHAERLGLAALAAVHGERLIVILAANEADHDPTDDPAVALTWLTELGQYFGPGPIVLGPPADDLSGASESARAALSGARSAIAWPEGPRVLPARDLLPERALAGNGHARRELVHQVWRPLRAAGGDLLETCVSFLDHGGSIEATARALFVHANTVRYRLKRITEVTGRSPAEPRDAYVLRLAITLGRLQTH